MKTKIPPAIAGALMLNARVNRPPQVMGSRQDQVNSYRKSQN